MKSAIVIIPLLTCFPWQVVAKQQDELSMPKADFAQVKLNDMMQHTASWLDNIGSDGEQDASAKGYLQLSWLPRTGNLGDIDAKFKVHFNLPRWNERLSLVIDNDNEDELLLDYETDNSTANQESVNVAIQYIKQFNNQRQIKNRIGVSRKQLYLRSEMLFNWQFKNVSMNIQPRLDYFLQDGWGPSVKGAVNYKLENSYFALSASWQKMQNETRSRRKIGLFHIISTGKEQQLVSGIQYNRNNNKLDISNQNVVISTRYRNLLYKSWMYFEVEPFIEFNQLNNYRREAGISFNLINYYGD